MNLEEKVIYGLIKNKVVDCAEIIVILFESCNLSCLMCPQDHGSLKNISEESILSKVNLITSWINKNKSKSFVLNIMGGEVFQDFLVEKQILSSYQKFIDAINNNVIDKSKKIKYNFVTNLVFNKTSEVLKFIKKNDLQITVSYDGTGRFHKHDLILFKKNVEIFKDSVSLISCVMTAPNMQHTINGDLYFDYLYRNFNINWDNFSPGNTDKINQFLLPSESETYEFYRFLVDRYPRCKNLKSFFTDEENVKMSCTRGNNITFLPDNSSPRGCSDSPYVIDREVDESKMVGNFFERYNCFSCKYFKKCPLTCFLKADYRYTVRDMDECVLKKTFEYVENKLDCENNTDEKKS